jgi:transcriptional regulator with XRE-family HTH domain
MGNPSARQRRNSTGVLGDGERASSGHRARVRQEDPKDTAPRDRAGAGTRTESGVRLDTLAVRWMRDDPEYRAAHAATEDEFTLASALIGARSRAGLSQTELAHRMGTSQAAIARIESGRYLPSGRTLQRFAEATGTTLRISFSDPGAAERVRRRTAQPAQTGSLGAAQPLDKASGAVQTVSLSDATLRAVQAHGEGATPDQVLTYLAREFGMRVRPNHLGIALQRHRRAGKLEENRDHRWFIPGASRC